MAKDTRRTNLILAAPSQLPDIALRERSPVRRVPARCLGAYGKPRSSITNASADGIKISM